ncbi:retrovirus-related pol polyprotein from transposon TNT 1-94 [Tanacetum coccineum]
MVKMHDGTVHTIREVRHMEGLKKNLLSLGQLDDLGCKVELQNKIMKIIKGALVLMRGEKVAANLYQLKGEIMKEAEASVASHSPSHRVAITWHPKLGHMSEQGMKILVERKLLPGLTKVSLPFCEHCVISKQHRLMFKTSNSRSVYVYLIKKKSDVFEVFKVYKARVELDSRKKIKCLRADNGGEYTSDEFDTFCRQEEIKRQFTTAYTPQPYGVAEQMNRTLLERERAMLATANLGKSFWAEAVNTAYLHIFGSPVYVMYNSQETIKLDLKSRKYLFLGYADEVKGCLLWDPTAHKVVVSRDIVFMEDKIQENEEAAPQYEVNETNESQAPAAHTLNRERRLLGRHSNYVMETNVAYCILTEKKPIGNKWVYKINKNGDDQVERYRARLVVKGYAQKEGIDFNKKNIPVVRMTTIQMVMALCATYDLHLEQLDVKTAFVYGNLEEEIYMLQPEGFKQKGKKNLVCRLNKSMYGLKQAPRCWYKRFDSFIRSLEYNRLHADPCIYFKRFGNNDFIILLLYVDDMLVAGPNKDRINKLKAQLAREFKMKDLGTANKILGMQIYRDRPISNPFPTNVKLSSKMIPSSEKERMNMSRVPHASAVGSLMFAMICTRPDIAHVVGVVSRYMAEPGDLDGSKSTIGYVFTLCGGTVSWVSKLQSVVAMSTTEAEYVAAAQANKEVVWLKMLLEELGHEQEKITLFCDNQMEEGTVDMRKIHTDDNVADYLTKAINCDKFMWCRSSCGLAETYYSGYLSWIADWFQWQLLIDRFRGKLSTWKANLLSIGGRLTLIKAVLGNLGIYYMSIFKCPECVLKTLESIRASFFWGGNGDQKKMAWIKWDNILASFEKGGLSIRTIHGVDAGIDLKWCKSRGTWANIVASYSMLHSRDIIPLHTLQHKVGNGSSIRFWKDNWVGNGPLNMRYNRLFHLDSNANCLLWERISNDNWSWNWNRQSLGSRNEEALEAMISEVGHVNVSNLPDSWQWNIAPYGVFSVHDTRLHLDNCLLPSLSPSTRWSNLLPRKIMSIICPSCNAGLESNDHIFFGCDTAINIWRLIRVWIDVNMPSFSSCYDWLQWIDDWRATIDSKDRVYVITAASLWLLWRYRNSVTFNSHPIKKSDIFDSIRMFSFAWLKYRGRKVHCWNSWLNNPLYYLF